MTLTKANIIDTIYNSTDLKKSQATGAFESTIGIIKSTLESGEDVLITGFGKFHVKDKKQRLGRNPQTGDGLMLEPRRVVTFQCSGLLKEKVNRGKVR
jgi:integration host factor subunit alpha